MIFVSLNKKLNNKVLLLILDGWGISSDKKVSAPDIAKTPNYNFLKDKNPNNYLITHGEQVGLPVGQMGNSEVGHMNIGSGRIVLQDLLRIDESIENGQFHKMKEFKEIISYTKNKSSNIHLVGLISEVGENTQKLANKLGVSTPLSKKAKNITRSTFEKLDISRDKQGKNYIL